MAQRSFKALSDISHRLKELYEYLMTNADSLVFELHDLCQFYFFFKNKSFFEPLKAVDKTQSGISPIKSGKSTKISGACSGRGAKVYSISRIGAVQQAPLKLVL